MDQEEQHRKRIKHYDLPGHVHELTFSCYQRRPLLEDDRYRILLSQSIDRATEGHGFNLLAFVYMPEHVHLLTYPTREDSLVSNLLFAIKKPFSFRVKKLMEEAADPLLEELTIRERPGKFSFRFWQEGPGYDRNITSMPAVNIAIQYLHDNPVRRALCDTAGAYKWSSYRRYFQPEAPIDGDLPKVTRLGE